MNVTMESVLIQNIGTLLRSSFQERANKSALISGGKKITYGGLISKAEEIAFQLRSNEVMVGEPIHVMVSNQPSDIAAMLGIWIAGGVLVPINRTAPEETLLQIQNKTHARYLIDYRSFEEPPQIKTLCAEKSSEVEILHDAAFVIFTSGSTGEPKGVVVSHKAFISKIDAIDSLLNFNDQDRVLLVLNINFVFGLWLAFLTLYRGGLLYMHDKFDPKEFISALHENKISRVGMVPTMMRIIFSNSELVSEIGKKVNTGSLSQILIGGESLGRSLALTVRKEFSKTDLIDIYGSTETASCDFFSFPNNFSKFPGSIGSPSRDVRYRIVNSNNEPVEVGTEGELQISSPYLMTGYLGDLELTRKAFSENWFKTGDIAKEVGPEVVELMGRSKELISRGGNKVTPGEIEQAICSYPFIAAALAVGIQDDILGERIHVLLVPNSMGDIDLSALKDHLKIRLEKYKIPDKFYISNSLPVGRTGKADRTLFKNQIICGQAKSIGQ